MITEPRIRRQLNGRYPLLGVAAAAIALVLFTSIRSDDSYRPVPHQFKDADAIVVSFRTDWQHYQMVTQIGVQKRILVLTARGAEHADQVVNYVVPGSRLIDLQARTVQPDGATIPVPEDLRHDLVVYDDGEYSYHALMFTFPGVKEGSILEWEYVIRHANHRFVHWWEVQDTIPTVEATFNLGFYDIYDPSLRAGHYSLMRWEEWCGERSDRLSLARTGKSYVCRNVPGIEDEPMSPPEFESRLRLLMVWHGAEADPLYEWLWDHTGAEWRKKIKKFTKDQKKLAELVSAITEGTASETETVDRIDGYVKETLAVRSLLSSEGLEGERGEAASVTDVIERQGGTATEVALTAMAMLQQAGIEVKPVLVGDRVTGPLVWTLPDPPTSFEVLLKVRADEEWVHLDPSCDYCPSRIPDWRHCNGPRSGIEIDLDTRGVEPADVPIVRPLTNSEHHHSRVVLSDDGSASVTGEIRWFGQQDVSMRRSWENLTDLAIKDDVRTRIAGDIEFTSIATSDPSDRDVELVAAYAYDHRDMAAAVSDRLLITLPDAFSGQLAVPVHEERKLPIWWPYPYAIIQQVEFTLPDGFAVEELPPRTTIQGPALAFSAGWARGEKEESLLWDGVMQYDSVFLDPEGYPEAREFAIQLRQAMREGVVARRQRPAASGETP